MKLTSLFPASWLLAGMLASAQAEVLIDYTFDGEANDVGPAAQAVTNGLDDAIAGFANTATGLIRTGQRSGSNPDTHAIGFNSSGTVDLSSFAGFTATFTVDSISLSSGTIYTPKLTGNGLFFGVVSGTNATGTAGTSLWNNLPQAIGYVPGSFNHGDHHFVMDAGSGTFTRSALTTPLPENGEYLNGFNVAISVFNDNTWQISSTGLGDELNDSGSLPAGIDYATFSQGVGLYTSLQGRRNSDLDMGRMTLTGITGITSSTQLVIAPSPGNAGNYDFTWKSVAGRVYDLVSATDLSSPVSSWSVWDGRSDLEATPDSNSLTNVPGGGDAKRFFAVVEKDSPPLLEENFDGAAALPDGWTSNGPVNGTDWEVGVPSGVASGPSAAASKPNCAGTNITGYYTENTDVSLVSPSIAIPADTAATLTFRQVIDTDAAGDAGSVRILDADNADTPISGLEITGLQGLGSSGDGWTKNSLVLPADEVGGKNIKIEFRFVSDAGTSQGQDVFSGFYIDDVVVTRHAVVE